jgi:hypothetical protein
MDKMKKLPREGVAQDSTEIDANTAPTDTEGHRLTNNLPGTGGDFSPRAPSSGGEISPRAPSSGGELIDENDVQGHGLPNNGPATAADFSPRQPRSGGEFGDEDVEGPKLKLK